MKQKFLWLFAALALALATVQCTGGERDKGDTPGRVTKLPEPALESGEIDQPLLTALLQAKNFHHIARVYMSDGNLPDAITAVRAIFAIEFPAGAPEAEDVRLDAYAMLGKLLLAQGKPEDAMKAVDEGIASNTRDSFFLANLFNVKGEIDEALAGDLEPTSDQARALKHAAIEAYTRSNQINEPLQKQLYEDVKGASE